MSISHTTYQLGLAAFILLAASRLGAQDSAPTDRLPGAGRPPAANAGTPLPPNAPTQPRFDLDFPGGTVEAFIDRVSKALGKPLNVILNPDLRETPIPPMKLRQVTVPSLFEAIGTASVRPSGGFNPLTGKPRSPYMHTFRTRDNPPGAESVWVFHREGEPDADGAPVLTAPLQVEVLNVSAQLAGRTIEDITTAIRTACEMTESAPQPKLTFHKETNLLIARGLQPHLELIHQVLQQLQVAPPPNTAKAGKGTEEAPKFTMSPELMRRYGLLPAATNSAAKKAPAPTE